MQETNSYTEDNRVKLVSSGKAYFDLLIRLIQQSVDTIYIQLYVFDDDDTGTLVSLALIRAAARGIKVYFLVDGFGANPIKTSFIKNILAAGVHFRWFRPILSGKRFYFGKRLHNKVVVIDAVYALVGGRNISDHYNDLPGRQSWLDMSVYIEGATAFELERVCVKMWNAFFTATQRAYPTPEFVFKQRLLDLNIDTPCKVRVRSNDWLKFKTEIQRSYYSLFEHATTDIIVLGSYFMPGQTMRRYMEKAAERGIQIKVVVTGVSDVLLAKYAERYLYKWMIRNNIEVYEYTRNVMHAKVAVRDNVWMTIGSFNLNNLSAHVSVELNVDVYDENTVSSVHDSLEDMIAKDCARITETNHDAYFNWLNRIINRIAYDTVRFVLYIVTFYYKRPKRSGDESGEYNY